MTVTGLAANTVRVMACEYTGSAGQEQYNSSTASGNPSNQTPPRINLFFLPMRRKLLD